MNTWVMTIISSQIPSRIRIWSRMTRKSASKTLSRLHALDFNIVNTSNNITYLEGPLLALQNTHISIRFTINYWSQINVSLWASCWITPNKMGILKNYSEYCVVEHMPHTPNTKNVKFNWSFSWSQFRLLMEPDFRGRIH